MITSQKDLNSISVVLKNSFVVLVAIFSLKLLLCLHLGQCGNQYQQQAMRDELKLNQ